MTSRKLSRSLLTGASALALAFAGTILVAGPAVAAPLSATTEAELITAIDTANLDVAADVITLGGNITLTNYLPKITESLTVIGTGFTIDGDGFIVFDDDTATPNIDLVFTNITVNNADFAIATDNSNVTITGSVFDGSQVSIAGTGITVSVTNSSFDNTGSGSGLLVDVFLLSTVTLTGVTADLNNRNGIEVSSENSTTLITGSSADQNASDGFNLDAFDASTMTVANGSADENGDNGLDADVTEGSTLNISSFTAAENDDSGIQIDAETLAAVTVTTITVTDNDDEGIDTDAETGATVSVSNSAASGNDDDGFDADTDDAGSSVTYSNLVSTNNDSSGFSIWIEGGSVTGSNLTGTGNSDAGLDVYSDTQGSATVSNSSFTGTTDDYGVVVDPEEGSTIVLQRLTVTGNSDGGISIDDDGGYGDGSTVTISDSTLADNNGTGLDIYSVEDVDVVLERSTISGNDQIEAGGIYALLYGDSALSVLNSTISGNTQDQDGAFYVDDDSDSSATVTIAHSTIVNNATADASDTGGVSLSVVQYAISHSIIAGNTMNGAPSDLYFDTQGAPSGAINYSLVQTSASTALAAVNAGTGNLKNVSAMLGALADNGGHALTLLPQSGSPVIDAGNATISGAPANDQRGNTRVINIIDLGAVETGSSLAATGADATLPATGGALALGLGILLLVVRSRLRAS